MTNIAFHGGVKASVTTSFKLMTMLLQFPWILLVNDDENSKHYGKETIDEIGR